MKASFSDKVFDVFKKIPRGQVLTYLEVARRAGCPQAARAVGNILNKNKHLVIIPCYRVILGDGGVGGYAGGVRKKIQLLRREGVKIKNEKLRN